jgi:hypothetical protein
MKTTTLVAIFAATATLALVQPAFAQTYDGSDAETSNDSSIYNFATPSDDFTPSYGYTPSYEGPVLAPAPEEPAAPMSGGYSSERSAGPWMESPESPFAQPFVNPSISATNPMRELPAVGGFHSPAGGFRR